MLLYAEELVKLGADGLVGGRELGGERQVRVGRHACGTEQVTDGDPLPDEQFELGADACDENDNEAERDAENSE
ncbi:MAG TPA: hypothetical protein VHO07_23045 [Streptosporangiaceae bacterium]|nr:hypothetical protein [Streptosporangiaceae bacterium]HEX2823013.1 hypothetical protein [Streptosporangiaceae bacterium]